jgi:hypothetical protein
LSIGVNSNEINAGDAFGDHSIDSVTPATADTDYP